MMETSSLPCVHILVILVHLYRDELPKTLVLERWSQAVKDRFIDLNNVDSTFSDSHVVAQYIWLLNACREFCTLACQSSEDFIHARKKLVMRWYVWRKKIDSMLAQVELKMVSLVWGTLPIYARHMGGLRKTSLFTTLWTKHTTKCSVCKVSGHNKLTCNEHTRAFEGEEECDFDFEGVFIFVFVWNLCQLTVVYKKIRINLVWICVNLWLKFFIICVWNFMKGYTF